MNNEKFSRLMYAFTKEAARHGFVDFLEAWDITEDDYDEIRDYLVKTYGIKPYL